MSPTILAAILLTLSTQSLCSTSSKDVKSIEPKQLPDSLHLQDKEVKQSGDEEHEDDQTIQEDVINSEEGLFLSKRSPAAYNFGLGKKRAYTYYMSEDKRLPVYNFGLGKRAKGYEFGLGKRTSDGDEEIVDDYGDDEDNEHDGEDTSNLQSEDDNTSADDSEDESKDETFDSLEFFFSNLL